MLLWVTAVTPRLLGAFGSKFMKPLKSKWGKTGLDGETCIYKTFLRVQGVIYLYRWVLVGLYKSKLGWKWVIRVYICAGCFHKSLFVFGQVLRSYAQYSKVKLNFQSILVPQEFLNTKILHIKTIWMKGILMIWKFTKRLLLLRLLSILILFILSFSYK